LRKDWGIAKITSVYDAHGNNVENAYYGTDGKPVLRRDWGIARVTNSYDARGYRVEQAYLGTDGKPALRKDWGIAKITSPTTRTATMWRTPITAPMASQS
jgi:hypothetical protein